MWHRRGAKRWRRCLRRHAQTAQRLPPQTGQHQGAMTRRVEVAAVDGWAGVGPRAQQGGRQKRAPLPGMRTRRGSWGLGGVGNYRWASGVRPAPTPDIEPAGERQSRRRLRRRRQRARRRNNLGRRKSRRRRRARQKGPVPPRDYITNSFPSKAARRTAAAAGLRSCPSPRCAELAASS